MKKKVLALTMGAVLLSPAAAFAEGNTGVADQVIQTKKEAMENKKAADAKDEQLRQSLASKAGFTTEGYVDGQWYGVTVPNYRQETGYWCGPASVRQNLSWHKTKSGGSYSLPSQTTLANQAGTTSDGSSSLKLRNTLNYYDSYYGFSYNNYVVARLTGDGYTYSNPQSVFETRVKGVLSNQTNAPIVGVRTVYIPRYGTKSLSHYMTISAYSYDYNTGAKDVRTVDPNWDSAYLGIYWDPIGTTTYKGIFKAAYEYDKYSLSRVSNPDYANYSMIY